MATAAVQNTNRDDLQELARGWGKIFATEAFPQGVSPGIDFNQMEELAGEGARALVQGIVREAIWKQGLALGDAQPCPTCGKGCRVEWSNRTVQSRLRRCRNPGTVLSLQPLPAGFFSLKGPNCVWTVMKSVRECC
jgi:hypothetical protein